MKVLTSEIGEFDMMVLVRRAKRLNPDGLLVGIFNAFDRIELFSVIDEFTDPYGCEYIPINNQSGFLLNNVTSQEMEKFYNSKGDGAFPKFEIDNMSELFMVSEMFDDDSQWSPVIKPSEETDFHAWWVHPEKIKDEQWFNLVIE